MKSWEKSFIFEIKWTFGLKNAFIHKNLSVKYKSQEINLVSVHWSREIRIWNAVQLNLITSTATITDFVTQISDFAFKEGFQQKPKEDAPKDKSERTKDRVHK